MKPNLDSKALTIRPVSTLTWRPCRPRAPLAAQLPRSPSPGGLRRRGQAQRTRPTPTPRRRRRGGAGRRAGSLKARASAALDLFYLLTAFLLPSLGQGLSWDGLGMTPGEVWRRESDSSARTEGERPGAGGAFALTRTWSLHLRR